MTRPTDTITIIGGGPAGLAAAEVIVRGGFNVDLYDAMPSLGRKFLMAGKSGLNLTHSEPLDQLKDRFGDSRDTLADMIDAFSPDDLRTWATDLGIETFVGSSGRVFPNEMKAAPLLRSWLRGLREHGLRVHVRHRWVGWSDDKLVFSTPDGDRLVPSDITVLALGGASWPQLGSDAAWVNGLAARGVAISPFKPSNGGFEVNWSDHLRSRHQGRPLKGVSIAIDEQSACGDCMITAHGLEGGPVYTLSAAIRDAIDANGHATIQMDLRPGLSPDDLTARLAKPRGKMSIANHLRKAAGIDGAKAALLFEDASLRQSPDPASLARAIKSLPIKLEKSRPISEAISSAGGIKWSDITQDLELRAIPGVFVAGEMIDWDAPTGGYLLTGCFATGHRAGHAVLSRLQRRSFVAQPAD